MKTLVVGNSLDVLPIIQDIFSLHQDEQVTLFTTEGVLPYDRSLLPALVAAAATEKQYIRRIRNFFKRISSSNGDRRNAWPVSVSNAGI